MTSQSDILEVLKAHRREITMIQLESVKDCKDFWRELTIYMDSALTTEDRIDCRVHDAMRSFAEVDTLEVVNKAGRLLKRFAKHYKTETGEKLTDAIQGILGDRLQYHLQNSLNTFYADFTDVIDWQDGQFGKKDSCWWGTYRESQDVFIDNGGWGIRFYDNPDDTTGIGRTWILPRHGKLYCFNSYGVSRAMTSKVIKAIYARHDIKLHYKSIAIENSYNDEIPYINGDSGFVLYPDDVNPDSVSDSYDVLMEVESDERESCQRCNCRLDYDECNHIEGCTYCDRCTNNLFSYCDRCEEYHDKSDVHPVTDSKYSYMCERCASCSGFVMCYECDNYTEEYNIDDYGDSFCNSCTDDRLTYCDDCEKYYYDEHTHNQDDTVSSEAEVDTSGLLVTSETIRIPNSRREVKEYQTTVYRLPDVQGLMMFHMLDLGESDTEWSISHELSGLAVINNMKSFKQAKRLLLAIAPLTDWNRSADVIINDTDMMRVMEQIRSLL